jgi:uncharacterized BrkB/YihY/UPF0761 family membrane protein
MGFFGFFVLSSSVAYDTIFSIFPIAIFATVLRLVHSSSHCIHEVK